MTTDVDTKAQWAVPMEPPRGLLTRYGRVVYRGYGKAVVEFAEWPVLIEWRGIVVHLFNQCDLKFFAEREAASTFANEFELATIEGNAQIERGKKKIAAKWSGEEAGP